MIKNIMQQGIYVILFSIMCISSANAQDKSPPGHLPMTRDDPTEPIRRSAIIERVREEFPEEVLEILSVTRHKEGGVDCHRVNTMSQNKTFRIIMVACN